MSDMYKLKEMLMKELDDYGARGQIRNMQDLASIDQLARACKNICKIMESSDGEYSGRGYSMDGYARDGYSRDGYSRDEGMSGRRYARRDSMGRYSRADGMSDKLKDMMEETHDEGLKREFKKLIERMESM